jgi:hypothetical protein
MSVILAVLAEDINREHNLARNYAETAIKHAVRCGELLTAKKAELPHGSFQAWVAANCEFKYSTAARYMKAAAQISTGVEISTLSEVFGSGEPAHIDGIAAEPDLGPLGFGTVGAHIGMSSGQITVGSNIATEEPAIVLFESRYRGFWHDLDFRHNSISCRPCRPDFLAYKLGSDVTTRGLSWSYQPDNGELRGLEESWRQDEAECNAARQ